MYGIRLIIYRCSDAFQLENWKQENVDMDNQTIFDSCEWFKRNYLSKSGNITSIERLIKYKESSADYLGALSELIRKSLSSGPTIMFFKDDGIPSMECHEEEANCYLTWCRLDRITIRFNELKLEDLRNAICRSVFQAER